MSGYVVMGVSGCGKSLVGSEFAAAMGLRFVDGDSLHPAQNIAKMSRGEALTDADRWPWLERVGQVLAEGDTVVACSALRRVYRDRIRAVAGPVVFFYLRGRRETLLSRMASRPGHFMPVSLLDSQLATLEEPGVGEDFRVADIEASPAAIVAVFRGEA